VPDPHAITAEEEGADRRGSALSRGILFASGSGRWNTVLVLVAYRSVGFHAFHGGDGADTAAQLIRIAGALCPVGNSGVRAVFTAHVSPRIASSLKLRRAIYQNCSGTAVLLATV
jgi:hypothetical protein